MRNLKKFLALVLAMMMAFSLMVTVNAATETSFKDDADITPVFSDAVYVLDQLEILQGHAGTGLFAPKDNITRGQFATILYRLATFDLAGKQERIYADYGKFDDVKTSDWFAGYVNYAAIHEYLKGRTDGNYWAEDNVTGYEVIVTLLRALGYNQKGEYDNAKTWQLLSATKAKELGITRNILEGTLGQPATREMVAEMVYRAMTLNRAVYYVNINDYRAEKAPLVGLSWASAPTYDIWGAPVSYTVTATWGLLEVGPRTKTYADPIEPSATYTSAIDECQIAYDVGMTADTTVKLYTNGDAGFDYKVQVLDEVQKIGAQGTLTRVYYDMDGITDRIVCVDTFLAQVIDVKDYKYDDNKHPTQYPSIDLHVYGLTENSAPYDPATTTTINSTINTTLWDTTSFPYEKGDYILVSLKTNTAQVATGSASAGTVYVDGDNSSDDGTNLIAALKGAVPTVSNTTTYAARKVGTNSVIHGQTLPKTGTQAVHARNSSSHVVDGTEYPDAKWLVLDQAGTTAGTYDWFYDQYNNVIGILQQSAVYSYGVVTKLAWDKDNTIFGGAAFANIKLMNGSDLTEVKVSRMDVSKDGKKTGTTAWTNDLKTTYYSDIKTALDLVDPAGGTDYTEVNVSLYATENAAADNSMVNLDLYRITELADGTLKLDAMDSTTYIVHELTGAKVVTGSNVITDGTNGKGESAATTIKVDSSTQFLLYNGVTYTAVTGIANVPTYTTCTVDYVDLNGDGWAEYVFIIGTPATSSHVAIFYPIGPKSYHYLEDGYWTVEGYLDGVKGTYKISDTGYTALFGAGAESALSGTTSLENGLNRPFMVLITEDMIEGGFLYEYGSSAYRNAGTDDHKNDALRKDSAYYGTDVYWGYHQHTDSNTTATGTADYVEYDAGHGSITFETQASNALDIVLSMNGVTPRVGANLLTQNMSNLDIFFIYKRTNGNNGVLVDMYIVDPNAEDDSTVSGDPEMDLTIDTISASSSSGTLTFNFTVTDGTETAVGDVNDVVVTLKLESQANGTGTWSEMGSWTSTGITLTSASAATASTTDFGTLSTTMNYRVTYTIKAADGTVLKTGTIGVVVS